MFRHEDATEGRFGNLNMKNVNILHIATHSYFWDKDKAEANGDMPFVNSKVSDNETMGGVSEEDDVLSRTGILMSDKDDKALFGGVMTAAEIANFYIRNLDLVVLSACNTASGEISDEATQILMTEFYRALFAGKSKHDALRQAQACMRKWHGGIYDSPYYWAAFVLLDA